MPEFRAGGVLMFRPLRHLAVVTMLAAALAAGPSPVGASSLTSGLDAHGLGAPQPTYQPPVDGVVVDPFRPPSHAYGPGNRGLSYATAPGSVVRAAAAGLVVFAGQVGGTLHVTVLHGDGLRTSYSFLASVLVSEGQEVASGQPIGIAGPTVHFGVRDATGRYLDPADLLAGAVPHVVLVPGGDDGAPDGRFSGEHGEERAAAGERAQFASLSTELTRRQFSSDELAMMRRLSAALDRLPLPGAPTVPSSRLMAGMLEWSFSKDNCRQSGADRIATDAPTRRIVVLVGGLGSSNADAAVRDVDTAALGYAPDDVLLFSYRDGSRPDLPYDAADTQQDLLVSADRLAELLSRTAAANPGVPIDVIAHSQGGVVARFALARAQRRGLVSAELGTVVTLGTPHRGAPLAGAAQALEGQPTVREALRSFLAAAGADIDPAAVSVSQLAPGSPLLGRLDARLAGSGVRIVSIAARGDLVVPSPRSKVGGEPARVIPLAGPSAHSRLPGDPRTTEEIRAAIAGLPARCRSFGEALVDEVTGVTIDAVETALASG
ncbi:MAG: peptidoglycan DD-metalloendopeptidase family protein [Acidimicrobiales bacterium]|nr:peptidoglycan DD-metalloendopeptidase family protein [Acidimicrobiales bacterium]